MPGLRRATSTGRWCSVVPRDFAERGAQRRAAADRVARSLAEHEVEVGTALAEGRIAWLTKPGIVVDADDVAVRSGRVKVSAPWGPDVPVIGRVNQVGESARTSQEQR